MRVAISPLKEEVLGMVSVVDEMNLPVCNEDSLYRSRLYLAGHFELLFTISDQYLSGISRRVFDRASLLDGVRSILCLGSLWMPIPNEGGEFVPYCSLLTTRYALLDDFFDSTEPTATSLSPKYSHRIACEIFLQNSRANDV